MAYNTPSGLLESDLMKILHAGNMANLAYTSVKQLRKDGFDVELLMEKNPPKGSNPLLFDPTLENRYPKWIHLFNKSKSSWKINVIKKMRNKEYDLIHAYVEFPIFAYLSRRTFIANTQGSDFRELAFSTSVRGFLLRRSYRKAKAVLFFQPDHLPLFSKLKLNNGIFFPPSWDTSFFTPKEFSRDEFGDNFIIFHPANLEWRLKGNEILINGFAKFVKDKPNSILIIVDRGIDSKKTHDLITQLNIENNVKFIPGPLNSTELIRYYNSADVIADQFVLGALGSIGWETFACAKPLLAYINETQYDQVYGEPPPLANASIPSLVSQQLHKLLDNKFRKELGTKSRSWITKYHSPSLFSQKIIKLYHAVLNDEPIDQIRQMLSVDK